MPEELLVAQCAPTLAGLKTGSLFSCPGGTKAEILTEVRRYNAMLINRGLRMLPVKALKNRVLVYVYRPQRLQNDLKDPLAQQLLKSKGYPVNNAELCVAFLIKRLKYSTDFPHEVGLFLGYPPTDVACFIKYGCAKAKQVGTWCVFGNVQAATRQFEQFKRCVGAYQKAFQHHGCFERLLIRQ